MSRMSDRIELTDPQAYIAKLRNLVGDRDGLEVLAETPAALSKLIDGVPAETCRCRPFAEKWTPNEIIGHLIDTEWVFGYRTRSIACDDNPSIYGIDQEKWVNAQHYNECEASDLVATFSTLRSINLRFWKSLTPEQRQRRCQHNERGQEKLDTFMAFIPGHDLSHIDQLTRYLAAVETQAGKG